MDVGRFVNYKVDADAQTLTITGRGGLNDSLKPNVPWVIPLEAVNGARFRPRQASIGGEEERAFFSVGVGSVPPVNSYWHACKYVTSAPLILGLERDFKLSGFEQMAADLNMMAKERERAGVDPRAVTVPDPPFPALTRKAFYAVGAFRFDVKAAVAEYLVSGSPLSPIDARAIRTICDELMNDEIILSSSLFLWSLEVRGIIAVTTRRVIVASGHYLLPAWEVMEHEAFLTALHPALLGDKAFVRVRADKIQGFLLRSDAKKIERCIQGMAITA